MDELLLHALTSQQLQAFQRQPSHALLLHGPAGSGKATVARYMAQNLLQLQAVADAQNHPYVRIIAPEAGTTIGIESIREIGSFLSLRVPGTAAINRAVIIENAQLMTPEAQNALLKLLEEPPAGTVILLTAARPQSLLPTIRSRSQAVAVKTPEKAATQVYFSARSVPAERIEQAYAISGGLVGLLSALLAQTDHPLLAATERARTLLSQTAYQRLLSVDELSRQPALTRDTLFILQQMAHVSLQTATVTAAKWQQVLAASYHAAEALQASGQAKLILTELMLSL